MKKYFNSQDAQALIDIYSFALFPIHGVKEDGTCTCNNPDCRNVGKHPATPDGFKSASKDIERVKQLWSGRKGLNVGIATGEKSGIVVVDIDDPKAEVELNKLIDLPSTYTVQTGRGKHLYFKYNPERPLRNGAHIIDGVDIRGDGGYVAGPGSHHANGSIYTVQNPLEDISEMPEGIYELMEKPKENKSLLASSSPAYGLLSREGWTRDEMREHLTYLNADMPHDDWVKIGMALQSEGNYYDLFDEWSRSGSKYAGSQETLKKWNSFSPSGGVTYGTIVALAKEGGWAKKQSPHTSPALTPPPSTNFLNESDDETKEEKKERTLFYKRASDLEPVFDVKDFVQGTLTEGALSVIYGESNCGKTFFASDLAFHVVEGKDWRGKRVEKGGVLYVSMEGAFGFKNRVAAYKRTHNVELNDLLVMPCTVDFVDPEGNLNEFIDLLTEIKQEVGDLKMIIIDTLARAVGGADENSGQDMGMLVRHADIIKEYTQAHICFIHHSGKDKAKGARGHSSLRAAVDTEIEISRQEGDNFSNIKFAKQRDMEMADDMQFALKQVTLGQNRHGEDIHSCVVEPTVVEVKERIAKLTPIQQFVYDSLVRAVDDYGHLKTFPFGQVKCVTYNEFREVMEQKGSREFFDTKDKTTAQQVKSATQSARVALQRMDKISFNKDYIWLMTSE